MLYRDEESQQKAEAIFDHHKGDYIKMTLECNWFKPDSNSHLKVITISQIWRDDLLVWNMKNEYNDVFFIFIYPFENDECKIGVEEYQRYQISDEERITKFYPRDLNNFILTL